MTDELRCQVRYFEDYAPGLEVDCGTFTIGEAEIIAFAKEYDPQSFHVDPVAAADSPVGGLIASGWQTGSLTMRLLVEHFISGETALGSPGIEELRWPHPVRPGDTLSVRATVASARRSRSKPDRGIVQSITEVTNQRGETVMTMKAANFFLTRDRVLPGPRSGSLGSGPVREVAARGDASSWLPRGFLVRPAYAMAPPPSWDRARNGAVGVAPAYPMGALRTRSDRSDGIVTYAVGVCFSTLPGAWCAPFRIYPSILPVPVPVGAAVVASSRQNQMSGPSLRSDGPLMR